MELICENVGYRYGSHIALSDINVEFESGVTGLLGPNGAGKSTLLSILATLRRPSHGVVTLSGRPLHRQGDKLRRSIGYLPQRFDLMRWSTSLRNVAYAAWAQGISRSDCVKAAAAALEVVDLAKYASRRVSALSGGQQQRLGIACAIAHCPSVVLLDEPTVGLDPAQRVQIRNYLARIGESAIVVLSTHIVEDLALLASNVVVLDDSRVAFSGSVASMSNAAVDTTAVLSGMSHLESAYVALLSQPKS